MTPKGMAAITKVSTNSMGEHGTVLPGVVHELQSDCEYLELLEHRTKLQRPKLRWEIPNPLSYSVYICLQNLWQNYQRTATTINDIFQRNSVWPRQTDCNSQREHLNCICCTINPPAFNSSITKVKSEDGSKWIYCHNQCPITHLPDSFIFSFWAEEYMNNFGPARPSLSSGRRWSMWLTKRMMQKKRDQSHTFRGDHLVKFYFH